MNNNEETYNTLDTTMTHKGHFIHPLFGRVEITCNPSKTDMYDGEALTLVNNGGARWMSTEDLVVGERLPKQHTCDSATLCNGTCW